MMTAKLSRLSFVLALMGVIGLPCARADIYTWTDVAGRVNVSNLTPPPDAHITSVFRTSPEEAAREQAAREAAQQSQLAALTDQVQQLRDEVAAAQRQPASAPTYWVAPSTPDYQNAVDAPAPQVYYDDNTAQQAASGCDASWNSCGVWTLPFFFPASVVVIAPPARRRFPPPRKPDYPKGPPQMHPGAPYAARTVATPGMHFVGAQPQMRPMAPPAMRVAAPQPVRTGSVASRR
jgi:hypothetical protein